MIESEWILYVEDDVDLRETIAEELVDRGYRVVAVGDGAAALAVAADLPRPALVITDLMMPGITGWELVATLRADATLCAVPILVLSAAHGRAPAGVDAVLAKPITAEALTVAIHTLQSRACRHGSCGGDGAASLPVDGALRHV